MKRIASVIAAAAMALSVLLVGPTSAFAFTQGSCSGSDSSKVLVYENRIGDTSDDDDRLWSCGNVTSMPIITIPSYCNGGAAFDATWNNCVGSYQVTIPAQQRFCAYDGNSYNSPAIVNASNYGTSPVSKARVNISTTYDDHWSSHRWLAVSSNC